MTSRPQPITVGFHFFVISGEGPCLAVEVYCSSSIKLYAPSASNLDAAKSCTSFNGTTKNCRQPFKKIKHAPEQQQVFVRHVHASVHRTVLARHSGRHHSFIPLLRSLVGSVSRGRRGHLLGVDAFIKREKRYVAQQLQTPRTLRQGLSPAART